MQNSSTCICNRRIQTRGNNPFDLSRVRQYGPNSSNIFRAEGIIIDTLKKKIGPMLIKFKYFLNALNNKKLMLFNKNLIIGRETIVKKIYIDKEPGGIIIIGEKTIIHKWVCLMTWGGKIEIGNNCSINSFCHINGNGGLKIGNNVRIAAQCMIIPANHNFGDTDIPITSQGETAKGIIIDDDVWIGGGVCILDGVRIGTGCVIGAGSIVNKSLAPYSVAVGIPAKVIKNRKET